MAGGATQPANGAGGGTTRSSHGKHSRAPQPQDHQSVDRESLWTTTELMLFVGSMSCLCTFLTLAASCGVFFLTNATRPANQRVWHPFQSSITTLGTAVPGANQGLDVAGSSTGASTSVWVPVRFKDHVDVSGALPPHLAPQTLFAVVGGKAFACGSSRDDVGTRLLRGLSASAPLWVARAPAPQGSLLRPPR